MAHSHYVLDLYFQDDRDSDVLRREVLRIEAHDDAAAIEEGIRVSGWRHPVRFDVRAIATSARSGHRLVHSAITAPEASPAEAPAAADAEREDTA